MKRNLIVLSSTIAVSLLSLTTWLYVLPIYLKNLGATDAEVGLSYTIFTLGNSVFQFPGGLISDRWGRKSVIAIPTYFIAISAALISLAKVWWIVTIFYTLMALLSSIQWPSFLAMIGESCDKRERAFSIFEFSLVSGLAFGPLIGYWLLNFLDIRTLIGITGIVLLLSAILRHLLLIETLSSKGEYTFKKIFTREVVVFLTGSIFLYLLFSLSINGPFISLHLKDFGLDERRINLIISYSTIFSLLVSIVSARMLGGGNLKRWFIPAILVHAVTIFIWSFVKPGNINILLLMASFGAVQVVFIGYNSMISQLSPENLRARTIGMIGSINGIVSSGGPYLGMMVKLAYSIHATFFLGVVFSIAGAIIFRRVDYPKTTSR